MFDFAEDDSPAAATTSRQRYIDRLRLFADGDRAEHDRLWLIHNCLIHPALALMPCSETEALHDLTSRWLGRHYMDGSAKHRRPPPARIHSKSWWILHNFGAHIAIGLLPSRATFAFHDWTAKKMNVPGWV